MTTANIGALEVTLTADPKPLEQAGKAGEKAMRDLEKRNREIAERISGTLKALGATFVAAMSAMGFAVRNAINEAAELGKMAQTIGVTTEALSGLKFAGEQTGVAFDDLAKGLQVLSKNMAAVAGGAVGPASQTLDALGISVRDASGALRSSDQVLRDVAGKFQGMEDGAGKAALAMALFGDEGLRLVPMLNQGASGLAAMEAEAARLGITVSGSTAKSAAEFNKTLNEIWNVLGTVAQRVAAEMLPLFQNFATGLKEAAKEGGALDGAVRAASTGFKVFLSAGGVVYETLRLITSTIKTMGSALLSFATGQWSEAIARIRAGSAELNKIILDSQTRQKAIWDNTNASMWETTTIAAQFPSKVAAPILAANSQISGSQEYLNYLVDDHNQKLSEGRALVEGLRTPEEEHQAQLQRLSELYRSGAIDAETYGKAGERAAWALASSHAAAAGEVTSALAGLFSENKAFAMANAVVNTAQAITKAFAIYGTTPQGFAAAAAAAASGAAQIKAIRSASKGGGGAPAVRGGSSNASSSGGQAADTGGGGNSGPSQTLFVRGINRNSLFSGDAVRDLAERLIQYQRDGGQIVLGSN